jgi:hypothetical protein
LFEKVLEVAESLALKPSAVPASNKRGKALMSPPLCENSCHLVVVFAAENAEHAAIWQAPQQRSSSSSSSRGKPESSIEHAGDSRAELRCSREQQREQTLDPLIFRLALWLNQSSRIRVVCVLRGHLEDHRLVRYVCTMSGTYIGYMLCHLFRNMDVKRYQM